MWNVEYEKGYFKALLDLSNFVFYHSEDLKHLRQRKFNLLVSLIKYLTENQLERDLFMKYSGNVTIHVNERVKECPITKMKKGNGEMKCFICHKGISDGKSMIPVDAKGIPNRRWICLDCKKIYAKKMKIPDDVKKLCALFDPAFKNA